MTTYTLLSIDWSAAPITKLERLWAVILLPKGIIKFIWTGKLVFLHKEIKDDV